MCKTASSLVGMLVEKGDSRDRIDIPSGVAASSSSRSLRRLENTPPNYVPVLRPPAVFPLYYT